MVQGQISIITDSWLVAALDFFKTQVISRDNQAGLARNKPNPKNPQKLETLPKRLGILQG